MLVGKYKFSLNLAASCQSTHTTEPILRRAKTVLSDLGTHPIRSAQSFKDNPIKPLGRRPLINLSIFTQKEEGHCHRRRRLRAAARRGAAGGGQSWRRRWGGGRGRGDKGGEKRQRERRFGGGPPRWKPSGIQECRVRS